MTVDWVGRLAEALECHPFDLLDAPPQAKTERERALLELFRGMSDEQQDAFFQATAALAKPVSREEGEMFELSLEFISSPWKLGAIQSSGHLGLKRTLLRLVFAERISYSRKTGLRTSQASVPFEFFSNDAEKCNMVRLRRLELPRVLPHSDLNAARLPFRHSRTAISLVALLYVYGLAL